MLSSRWYKPSKLLKIESNSSIWTDLIFGTKMLLSKVFIFSETIVVFSDLAVLEKDVAMLELFSSIICFWSFL